jgi:hypothetical protein
MFAPPIFRVLAHAYILIITGEGAGVKRILFGSNMAYNAQHPCGWSFEAAFILTSGDKGDSIWREFRQVRLSRQECA